MTLSFSTQLMSSVAKISDSVNKKGDTIAVHLDPRYTPNDQESRASLAPWFQPACCFPAWTPPIGWRPAYRPPSGTPRPATSKPRSPRRTANTAATTAATLVELETSWSCCSEKMTELLCQWYVYFSRITWSCDKKSRCVRLWVEYV